MLTRAQIQRIAQRNGIGVHAQELDYVQYLLLWRLYSRSQALVLKGGAALRIVYSGNRYSEGLDFYVSRGALSLADLRLLWQNAVRGLEDFGIPAELRNEWISDTDYRFDVGFQGPLWDGHDQTEGMARVAVDGHVEELECKRELVTCEYDDVRPFVITALTPEYLMADKVLDVMLRRRPRDLYDLWLMLGLGVRPDHRLIEGKLAREGVSWHLREFMDALDDVRIGWTQELRHLLPQPVAYEVVRDGVVAWLMGV